MAGFYSHYVENLEKHQTTCDYILSDEDILPYKGNEDKLEKEN